MKMKSGCLKSDTRLWLDVVRQIVCGAAFLTLLLLTLSTGRAQDSGAEAFGA